MSRWLIAVLAFALSLAAGAAAALERRTYDLNADAVVKHLMALPPFAGLEVGEAHATWSDEVDRIVLGTENGDAVSAVVFVRDGALQGLRLEIPLLPSADPGLYAFADIALGVEPALAGLDHADGIDAREAVKRWAGELGLESWMRPRYGAYRLERRVGATLFVFEGVPLERFWVSLSPVGDGHPVLDDLLPYVPAASRAAATPVLTAVERGEYKLANRLAAPHAEAGEGWALLVRADYGEPVGFGREMSAAINRMLEASAATGYAPAQYVLGQPDSNVAERWLKQAAAAGYAPAIALKASRRYGSARADDPAARCDELAALQGNAMAQLRTVYRYAEGGGSEETAYFWARVTIESFGETASFTAERYILHTLGVLYARIPPERRTVLEDDAAAWKPQGFAALEARYAELGCLD